MSYNTYRLFSTFLLLWCFNANATHNRAGEITYVRIAPFSKSIGGGQYVQVYTYSITVTKYTNDGTNIADRCIDTIYFGDGTFGFAGRTNGPIGGCGCASFNGKSIGCGEKIINELDYVVKLNTYTITHTYPSQGNYLISTIDPNRNGGIKNIPHSDQYPFYIKSLLVINNFTGANSSPIFTFRPIDKACVGVCFEHNPGAYDPDGDSLSYQITTSKGADGNTVPGYQYPNYLGGTYEINAVTGKLSWCTPVDIGEYNLAFIVYEWRKNANGIYENIGYVLRDMQVVVRGCKNNQPPSIEVPPDLCVEAGKSVTTALVVRDPNNADFITVEGGGGSFESLPPIASFSPKSGVTNVASGSKFNVLYSWQTVCEHIRKQPYYTTFKVTDDGAKGTSVKLVSFNTFNIRVVPPSVKNVTATPLGSNIRVSWSLSSCSPTNNPLVSYKIYRQDNCTPIVFDPCQTGIPDSSNFDLIATVDPTTNFYIDSNGSEGLVIGQDYSYVIVAQYQDGAQTYGSAQVCAKLKRDVPVLLNVDVKTTSSVNGVVWIRWTRPLSTPGNLDTIALPGPYHFNLKFRDSSSASYKTVFSVSHTLLSKLDTQYFHNTINTTIGPLDYMVEFVAGNYTVGTSQKASSVFLVTTPSDRKMNLSWSSKTPWNNYKYTIMRQDSSTFPNFVQIATTSLTTYTDITNVVNGSEYCYYIISEGSYSDPALFKPLVNASEIACSKAKDLTPPTSPTLSIDAECPIGFITVSWTDIKTIPGSDDVYQYELYFKKTVNDPYTKIATVMHNQLLSYTYDDTSSVAGCYAVRAIDKNENVGELSQDFCIDNCPEFELPNIFSPNGDGTNDFYQAIKVRQIKEINLSIIDRWGNLIYSTKDPYFKWNGVNSVSKAQVSESTFFYVCDVYEPRLRGIVKRTLKGIVQVVR